MGPRAREVADIFRRDFAASKNSAMTTILPPERRREEKTEFQRTCSVSLAVADLGICWEVWDNMVMANIFPNFWRRIQRIVPAFVARVRAIHPFNAVMSLVLLALVGGGVYAWFWMPEDAFKWFAASARLDVVRFIAYLVGGLLLGWQVWISNRRAAAFEDTVRVGREGNIAERFKNAIEHLGSASMSVRIGGIHVLYSIAKAKESREYARAVLEILAAHLREKSKVPNCSDEVKTIVRILFPNFDEEEIFKMADSEFALKDIDLAGANLERAHLDNRSFFRVDFSRANLTRANLEGSFLCETSLECATLKDARLQGAELRRCALGSADCQHADFSKASLDRGNDSCFVHTDLSHADFRGAEVLPEYLMEASTLYGAKMDGDVLAEIQSQKPELLAPPSDS